MTLIVTQTISLAGAALILTAYVAAQLGWLRTEQPAYGVLNLVGAGLLTYVAVVESQIGFIVLEGVWTVVSAITLLRRRPAP